MNIGDVYYNVAYFDDGTSYYETITITEMNHDQDWLVYKREPDYDDYGTEFCTFKEFDFSPTKQDALECAIKDLKEEVRVRNYLIQNLEREVSKGTGT